MMLYLNHQYRCGDRAIGCLSQQTDSINVFLLTAVMGQFYVSSRQIKSLGSSA